MGLCHHRRSGKTKREEPPSKLIIYRHYMLLPETLPLIAGRKLIPVPKLKPVGVHPKGLTDLRVFEA